MDYLNEPKVEVKEEPQQSMVDLLDCDMPNKPKGWERTKKRGWKHSKEYMYDQHLTLYDGWTVMYIDQMTHWYWGS